MSLEQDIANWALTRPAWQQEVLADLAQGKRFDAKDHEQLAAALTNETGKKRKATRPLTLVERSESVAPTRLRGVQIVGHVNRLLADERLTFEPEGLTVVYGDNASGKSGFARVIKNIARARHQEPVLTDIFADTAGAVPVAELTYASGTDEKKASWPAESPDDLARLHFYDRSCGDDYIAADSEVSYRPSILTLFDQLIEVCDSVRVRLDALVSSNVLKHRNLPEVRDPQLARFLDELGPKTSDAEVAAACKCPPDARRQIALLMEEEARLVESNPEKERERLLDVASRLDTVSRQLKSLDTLLGEGAELLIRTQMADVTRTREVADAASRPSFEGDLLPGTGNSSWQSLWDAARQFSESSAYPREQFPALHQGARCVLCQQEVDTAASARLRRFAAALSDNTEQQAELAQRRLAQTRTSLTAVDCLPPKVSAALALLDRDEPRLSRESGLAIDEFAARKTALVGLAGSAAIAIKAPTRPNLESRAEEIRRAAEAVDDSQFQARLTDLRSRRAELESREAMAAAKVNIESEVLRRRERDALDRAKKHVDTATITRKSTELARGHVTAVITDRFTRESDRLKLERITLKDIGGRKGQLRQRPAFLAPKQQADMSRVLSEGEQTALGLAGFFTEAELDGSRSALIFDDPVSSLSHRRRSVVAGRLSAFARDRQVIVFTHDLEFAGELAVAAENENVRLTERQITRNTSGEPGVCLDGHPWKAKNAKGRLAQLGIELKRLESGYRKMTTDELEVQIADWAGRLSETWERIIKEEISDQLVDPSKFEVRPKMIKLVARITDDDAKIFEESYSRISRWARRHDKARAINYVAPDFKEMAAEHTLIGRWFDRIRKYRA